ncbi:MAG TPA: Tim44 domain-containing protein, partial [Casimicrobiaceae bacterium]|nr:Tim44 domain-containing protein [Casimicrobiaceae bacterium]
MRFPILALAVAALIVVVAAGDADAKRLGGGRSFGAQRQSAAPSVSSPGPAANPVMPAQPGSSAAKPAAPAAAPPAGGSRWLGPIAGIAAGLGLAALLAHFGLPEGFGSVLLLALVAFGAVLLFRTLTARRAPAAAGIPADDATKARPRVEPMLAPPPASTGPAANPVMPAQPGTSAAKPAAPAPAPPAGGSRWLGPIAGIAAGLGLAALLAH